MTNRVDAQEIKDLFEFIAKKSKKVTCPLPIWRLSNEFLELNGHKQTVCCMGYRIKSHARNIHKMNQFDTETKVKMMFALSASVDYGFLEELRKNAEVKLDDSHRIIEYKDKQGGLTLSGTHAHRPPAINEKDKKILNFLSEKAENEGSPIPDQEFLVEFKKATGATDTLYTLTKRYLQVKKEIYTAVDFDKQSKIRMMFVSGSPVADHAIRELRNDALIQLDSKHRITKYKANDGSLELEGAVVPAWQRVKKEEVEDDEYGDTEKENNTWQTPKRRRGPPIPPNMNSIKVEPKVEAMDEEPVGTPRTRGAHSSKAKKAKVVVKKEAGAVEPELVDLEFDEPMTDRAHSSAAEVSIVVVENEPEADEPAPRANLENSDFDGPQNTPNLAPDAQNRAVEVVDLVEPKSSEAHNSVAENPETVVENEPRSTENHPKNPPARNEIQEDLEFDVPQLAQNGPGAPTHNYEDLDFDVPYMGPQMAQNDPEAPPLDSEKEPHIAQNGPQDSADDPASSSQKSVHSKNFNAFDIEMSPIEQEIEVETEEKEENGALQLEDQMDFQYEARPENQENVGNGALQLEGSDHVEVVPQKSKQPDALQLEDHMDSDNFEFENGGASFGETLPEGHQEGALQLEDHMNLDQFGSEFEVVTSDARPEHRETERGALQLEDQSEDHPGAEKNQKSDLQLEDHNIGDAHKTRKEVPPILESQVLEQKSLFSMEILEKPAHLAPKDVEARPLEAADSTKKGASESITTSTNSVPKHRFAVPEISENELISISTHIQFLESINTMIKLLDLLKLQDLKERIEKKIEKIKKLGSQEEKVTLSELHDSIFVSLLILSKSKSNVGEESINLKDFLIIYRTTLVSLRLPILEDSNQKLKKIIEDVPENKKISVERVKCSLRILVEFLSP